MILTGSTPPDPAAHARTRRARLSARLADLKLDAAILTDPDEVTYFTGVPLATPAQIPACLLVRRSGESVLVCGESPAIHHVEQTEMYRWHNGGTIYADLLARLVQRSASFLRNTGSRLGIQYNSIAAQLLNGLCQPAPEPIDRIVADLERSKDALDLFHIRNAVATNLAAFDAAAGAITPGANELEVFAAASRGAMLHARAKVIHDGDYRCGAPGGACRDHVIRAGEMYTIDAWTKRAGYWSDLARTFAVGPLTDDQSRLIHHVRNVHEQIRPLLRPGTSSGDLWAAIDGALREHAGISRLVHHGGHGIGLRLHEAPDINPDIADTLRTGDVICIEPGAYFPGANVRIEETYLVTNDGAECLSCDTATSVRL